jgi:hypothetical protein
LPLHISRTSASGELATLDWTSEVTIDHIGVSGDGWRGAPSTAEVTFRELVLESADPAGR